MLKCISRIIYDAILYCELLRNSMKEDLKIVIVEKVKKKATTERVKDIHKSTCIINYIFNIPNVVQMKHNFYRVL